MPNKNPDKESNEFVYRDTDGVIRDDEIHNEILGGIHPDDERRHRMEAALYGVRHLGWDLETAAWAYGFEPHELLKS
jgi:hypothetical protein